MASAVTCPRCGAAIAGRDIDLASGSFLCAACKERFPLPGSPQAAARNPLDVATPVNPIAVPPSVRPLGARGVPAPPAPAPAGAAATPASGAGAPASPKAPSFFEWLTAPVVQGSPFGKGWKEDWDGVGWHVVLRRVGLPTVVLLIVVILGFAWWASTQPEVFGDFALVIVGVFVVVGVVGVTRLLGYTYMRFDARQLVIQHRPRGGAAVVSSFHIHRFVAIPEEAPGRKRALFPVGVVPREGIATPIDLDLYTEAEAKFVAERLNYMLEVINGTAQPPKPSP